MAIDQNQTACGTIGLAFASTPAGAKFYLVMASFNLRRDGPGIGTFEIGELIKICAAQAPPGGEQRNGFEQIGLSRPVGTGEGQKARGYIQPQAGIVAKISQCQAGEGQITMHFD